MNKIIPVQVGYHLGVIRNNLEEVKASVEAYCKDYENVVISEDSIKDGKNMLANIRKEKKALEDQRKAIKKAWNKPYTEFEKECKEVEKLYDMPINLINNQLTAFEEDRKQKKLERCKEIFAETPVPEEITGWFEFENIFDGRWLNATYSEANIKKDIETTYNYMAMNLNTIKSLHHEFEAEGIEFLKETHDLQSAMMRMSSLLETKKALEEKAAEEARRKAEEQADPEPQPELNINVPEPGEFAQVSFIEEEPMMGFDDFIAPEKTWIIKATITDEKDAQIAIDFLKTLGAEITVREE